MKTETIREYTILYQYLLLLKEPLYLFLIQIFQHLSPVTWWDDFIQPVLQRDDKENFKYLDIVDLLNVFKMNWEKIFKYLDKDYYRFKYNTEYKTVNQVHKIRTAAARANETDMPPWVFADSLAVLLDFAKLIQAREPLPQKLEQDRMKYSRKLPGEPPPQKKTEALKERIVSTIEEKVLLKAVSFEGLEPDIKLSLDRTILRFHSLRTLEETMGFFNNAMRSERGIIITETLHCFGLPAFEDIKDEVNALYDREFGGNG
jgi:hypothetical protein